MGGGMGGEKTETYQDPKLAREVAFLELKM